jgi:hypothetical protein
MLTYDSRHNMGVTEDRPTQHGWWQIIQIQNGGSLLAGMDKLQQTVGWSQVAAHCSMTLPLDGYKRNAWAFTKAGVGSCIEWSLVRELL